MAFLTITVTPDLSVENHRRAVRAGPPSVSSGRDTPSLLTAAGFDRIALLDVTEDYLRTARAWLQARERHRAELVQGRVDAFEQGQRDKRRAIAAIEAGWLRRELVTAIRPLSRVTARPVRETAARP